MKIRYDKEHQLYIIIMYEEERKAKEESRKTNMRRQIYAVPINNTCMHWKREELFIISL